MTKKLEELFDLPSSDDEVEIDVEDTSNTQLQEQHHSEIASIEDNLTISEKINSALAEVRGMEGHDSEMDEIAQEALESYKQLMSVGFNMTDMAAGPVFSNAAAMLKVALEARDSKVSRKLKQIDMMLKKERLDQQKANKKDDGDDDTGPNTHQLDRNEILRMLGNNKGKD